MQLAVLADKPIPVQTHNGPRSISSVRVMRLSITDRCNFRCSYCMPEQGVRWLPRDNLLTADEIRDVVLSAISLHNIRRFKLTGGEPTLRPGLVELVRSLRDVDGIEELSLTTNGFLLTDLAKPLFEAGLDRITISIDSLIPRRFARITRTGNLQQVLAGLEAVFDAGFTGTKVNCVAMRGINDDEYPAFAKLTLDRRLTVRFIEYMPLGDSAIMHLHGEIVNTTDHGPAGGCGAQNRGAHAFISEPEIRQAIETECGEMTAIDRRGEPGVGPATVYRLPGAPGRIGFISAMSQPFCDTCNRLRLTAEGILRSCLFEGGEVPIRDILRSTSNPAEKQTALANAMTRCIALKPTLHSGYGRTPMSRIGG